MKLKSTFMDFPRDLKNTSGLPSLGQLKAKVSPRGVQQLHQTSAEPEAEIPERSSGLSPRTQRPEGLNPFSTSDNRSGGAKSGLRRLSLAHWHLLFDP